MQSYSFIWSNVSQWLLILQLSFAKILALIFSFKVMESCWIEAPESRPNFRELKKIFDNMISQGIEDDYTAIISTPLNANRI
jgi:hypothetical protein